MAPMLRDGMAPVPALALKTGRVSVSGVKVTAGDWAGGVGRLPDASTGGAEVDGVAGGVGWIDGDGGDAAGDVPVGRGGDLVWADRLPGRAEAGDAGLSGRAGLLLAGGVHGLCGGGVVAKNAASEKTLCAESVDWGCGGFERGGRRGDGLGLRREDCDGEQEGEACDSAQAGRSWRRGLRRDEQAHSARSSSIADIRFC